VKTSTDRPLSGADFFLLWMGAAISLAEIWAGGLLAPLGLFAGLAAIVLGHVIGNTPMALGGIIGSRHEVPAMVSTRDALGHRGSYLPAVLNVIQLTGWTAVMLRICGQAADAVVPGDRGIGVRGWILVSGILTTAWALTGHGLRRWLQRGAVTLLTALSLLMTGIVFRRYGLADLLAIRPDGTLPFGQGLDLVIAMPISWLPLVSDYSRFARDSRSCFWGTWWGYLLAGSWMYAVGLCAALAARTANPDGMVLGLMAETGLIGPALLIIILSTITTTFLDMYSTAVSVRSLAPKWNERAVILAGGLLGTLLAVVFPATEYESFLLFIGAMFCPLFGVVLADYFILRRMQFGPPPAGIRPDAMLAWAAGFALYQLATRQAWALGASLPALLGAAGLHLALRAARHPRPGPSPGGAS